MSDYACYGLYPMAELTNGRMNDGMDMDNDDDYDNFNGGPGNDDPVQ